MNEMLVYLGAAAVALLLQYLIIRLAIQHALQRVLAPSVLHARTRAGGPPW